MRKNIRHTVKTLYLKFKGDVFVKSENQENKCIIKKYEFAKLSTKNKICFIVFGILGVAYFTFGSFALLLLGWPIIQYKGISKERKQEIIDTFAGFENRGEVVFVHDYIFLPNKRIEYAGWNYSGTESYNLIGCGAESYYVLTRSNNNKKPQTVNLLEVGYEGEEKKLLATWNNVPNPNKLNDYYFNNKLFVGPFDGEYYVYDLATQTLTTMSEVEFKTLPELDYNGWKELYNYTYEIYERTAMLKLGIAAVEITSKSTGEVKAVTLDRLNAFPEGQFILSLNSCLTDDFFKAATEKDGYIYLLGMIKVYDMAILTQYQYQNVVLRYDFENDILSYYSSMLYPWDEIPQMTIL